MRWTWVAVVAIVVSVLPLAASNRGLVVRVYNTYGLSTADVAAASRTVSALLSRVAIDVRWRDCVIVGRRASDDADRCADPLERDEVIVRLVAGGLTFREQSCGVLGYSFIDPALRAGTLATIYVDRAVSLSPAFASSAGAMVGRAVAHELGHMLTGDHTHSPAGLMREQWRPTSSFRDADWAFTLAQGVAMRSGLELRR